MSRSAGDSWPNSRNCSVRGALTVVLQLNVMHTPGLGFRDLILLGARKGSHTYLLQDVGGGLVAMKHGLKVGSAKLHFTFPWTSPMFEAPGQTMQQYHFLCLQLSACSSL